MSIEVVENTGESSFGEAHRDSIYGHEFQRRAVGMQIEEVITAPIRPGKIPTRNE